MGENRNTLHQRKVDDKQVREKVQHVNQNHSDIPTIMYKIKKTHHTKYWQECRITQTFIHYS